jgi:hypothetical protein
MNRMLTQRELRNDSAAVLGALKAIVKVVAI